MTQLALFMINNLLYKPPEESHPPLSNQQSGNLLSRKEKHNG
jgi:hypothetical protein